MKFQNFDNEYVARLRMGDLRTQEHFVGYFTELLKVKLRTRLRSPEDREDAKQETFARVFAALRKQDGIRQPERIGAFVNSVCNNVLRERYRGPASESLENRHTEIQDRSADVTELIAHKQTQHTLRGILDELSARDSRIIRQVFLEELSRDKVCRDHGANRGYLRVLVHRAKQAFKSHYVKRVAISNRSRFQTIARCADGVH